MKRGLIGLVCTAIFAAVFSFGIGEGLPSTDPLTSQQIYPQGAEEATASYIRRLELPQFIATAPQDQAINDYYRQRFDAAQAALPEDETAMLAEPGAPAHYEYLRYQVTANTDAYLSVVLTTQQFLGYVESETVEGNVFARQGIYAGQKLSLSQVMGLEAEAGIVDPLSPSYASQLVWKLVWKTMEEQKASLQTDYFDDLTKEDLQRACDPEKDFYIDLDGNLVFYIQAGILAGDVEGILTFPFAEAELLLGARE